MKDHLEKAAAIREQLRSVRGKIEYYPRLKKTLKFAEQEFSMKITTRQAADQAAMSRSAFSRRFKAAAGISFHQFLVIEGIRRAITLIETSDESLTNIALEAGFESLDTFEYNFSKHIGCAPMEYRTAYLESKS